MILAIISIMGVANVGTAAENGDTSAISLETVVSTSPDSEESETGYTDYICEGTVWNSAIMVPIDFMQAELRYVKEWIEGTVEINGVSYMKAWRTNSRTNFEEPEIFLIRKEGSKVYYYDEKTSSDYVLYDFDATKGEYMSITPIITGQIVEWDNVTCQCLDIFTESYANNDFKIIEVEFLASGKPILPGQETLRWIEGMGSYAGLVNNMFGPNLGGDYLLDVTHNGEIVFKGDYSAVELLRSDIPESENAPIYDIMGRVVKETVPGSVYIRGGKKFVAK